MARRPRQRCTSRSSITFRVFVPACGAGNFLALTLPEGLTPDISASAYAAGPRAQAIALAARDLTERREAWFDPPDLVTRVSDVDRRAMTTLFRG